jgi:hypothetical protein
VRIARAELCICVKRELQIQNASKNKIVINKKIFSKTKHFGSKKYKLSTLLYALRFSF